MKKRLGEIALVLFGGALGLFAWEFGARVLGHRIHRDRDLGPEEAAWLAIDTAIRQTDLSPEAKDAVLQAVHDALRDSALGD